MLKKESARDFMADHVAEGWRQAALEATAKSVQELDFCESPDQVAVCVLQQLCDALFAQRTYLYQLDGNEWLLYEWNPTQQTMTKTNIARTVLYPHRWQGDEPLLLDPLDALREVCPPLFECLHAREVTRAAVIPLESDGIIIGCLGADQPTPESFCCASLLLRTLGRVVMTARSIHADRQELERLRLYDGLTGVFCRNVYLRELQTIRPAQKPLGIIRLHIADIKHTNECYGYARGDELLVKCAQHIGHFIGSAGQLYRVGCDEFAIICTGLDRESFERLAMQLSSNLEQTLHCVAAVGYQWTPQPRTIQGLDLAAESMMEADKRRYMRIQALTEHPYVVEDDVYGMLTLEGLTTLVESGRFIVYLQPKLSFQDGMLVGAEALVRFLDSNGAIVEPGQFLPDLESAMLIQYIDFYVFEQVCRLIRMWLNEKKQNIPISVNFSKMTLGELNLVPRMLHLCHKYSIEPTCLEIEIVGGQDRPQSRDMGKIVDRIRTAGFLVSVDDFGIRFANLSLLIALDCDKLKLDKSLIENVTTNPKAWSVLKALSALCTATGTRTTVEGIETEEQLALLKHMGFDEMQGYLISQPLTISGFKEKYL